MLTSCTKELLDILYAHISSTSYWTKQLHSGISVKISNGNLHESNAIICYLCSERKNPSYPGSPMAHSMIICRRMGCLHFSVSQSQVSFTLCVLFLNLQSKVWLIWEMLLKIIGEMPFFFLFGGTYVYSCLSFVQEIGPEKKKNRARSPIIHSYD